MEDMEIKVGDKVRVKSREWYLENRDEYGRVVFQYGYHKQKYVFGTLQATYCGMVFRVLSKRGKKNPIFGLSVFDGMYSTDVLEKVSEDTPLSKDYELLRMLAHQWYEDYPYEPKNKETKERFYTLTTIPKIGDRFRPEREVCAMTGERRDWGIVTAVTRIGNSVDIEADYGIIKGNSIHIFTDTFPIVNNSPFKKKLKVGTKVIIKDEKWYKTLADEYGSIELKDKDGDFSNWMAFQCGKEMTIEGQYCHNQYKLEGSDYWWPDWCFDVVEKESEKKSDAKNNQTSCKGKRKPQKTYLMTDENTGYTKIGKAQDPHFREKTLQSEKPTIVLFKVCEELVERQLHCKFSEKRIRGEWFDLTKDEIEWICRKYKFKDIN